MKKKSYLIIVIVTIDIISLNSCLLGTGYGRYVNENIRPLNINAIVVKKYEEKTGCFGAIVVKQGDCIDTLQNIFICAFNDERIWEYVLPKDSLYKEKGSLKVEVVRNGNRVKFTFPTSD